VSDGPSGSAEHGQETPVEDARPGSQLAAGWWAAVRGAVAAAVATGALAEAVWFVAYAAGRNSPGRPSAATVARLGGALFLIFHHVDLRFQVSGAGALFGELLGTGSVASFTVSLAVLGGTVLAAWLLYRAGRLAAGGARGPDWVRGLHGAKVALPYALICVAVTPLLRFGVAQSAGTRGGLVAIRPSPVSAFLWPFAIALVAGFAGGLRSVGPTAEGAAWERRARAALAGGWRMLWVGLALSFGGLLVLAAVRPDATGAYFRGAFGGGTAEGLVVLLFTALAIPNMAGWILFLAMGGCLAASGAGSSLCFLSFEHFPASAAGSVPGASGAQGFAFLPAPAAYFLFLLVPLVAVVAGGTTAARRARAGSASQGALAGALAGVAFGVLAAGALALSLIAISLNAGPETGTTLSYGPQPVGGIVLAFAWGILGGAAGGALAGRLQRSSVDGRATLVRAGFDS
jgi:hypothetical protein